MHELKNNFDVLMARMDDVLLLLESGSSTSAELLVPRLREQAAKTAAILDEAIQDFSLMGVVDEFLPEDPEFPDDDEDEDEEKNSGMEEVAIGEESYEEEEEDEEEDEDDKQGDGNDNSQA